MFHNHDQEGTKVPLIVLVGPTAVGKSETALTLAQEFDLAIINADSMQVYRSMDIGSAKPSLQARAIVPHHLIDIRNPDEEYSAAQFREEALALIFSLDRQGKRALVVGGTGLYIKALTRGLFPSPSPDLQLRRELREKEKTAGKWSLYRELKRLDPEAASKIHPNDIFRIIRALEIVYLTGIPISQHQKSHQFTCCPFRLLTIGLTRERKELYQRIEQRVDTMVRLGLVAEVQSLLGQGYPPTIKPFQSLGYKQILRYLQGEISLHEAIRLIKRDTKRYAKRQYTWFKQDKAITWFYLPGQLPDIEQEITKFLQI